MLLGGLLDELVPQAILIPGGLLRMPSTAVDKLGAPAAFAGSGATDGVLPCPPHHGLVEGWGIAKR